MVVPAEELGAAAGAGFAAAGAVLPPKLNVDAAALAERGGAEVEPGAGVLAPPRLKTGNPVAVDEFEVAPGTGVAAGAAAVGGTPTFGVVGGGLGAAAGTGAAAPKEKGLEADVAGLFGGGGAGVAFGVGAPAVPAKLKAPGAAAGA